ncbi:right-handed parallel beta-helix repeat-containing protein [Paenibacillus glycanilyticus]|uniref:Alpha-1,3-galactosidase A n=1 Tax=Paenibacillus glycanilyticus TaxID=126569 RepID=A0ABQ6GDV1_9BACL|nr:right-handed parallel beta-helix repeat-containing protein [Paenibacillus glycanilyticus]GLX68817.1 alpha-1,3-galactosidase A [Paenibacillus glycanilyticus]
MNPTVIQLADFGGRPDSGEDTTAAMRGALEAAAIIEGPVVLACERGRYEFFPEQATRAKYYISNTASEEENPDVTRTIGILLQGIRNLILDGNGSLFVFHGKQTMIVIDGCEEIAIRHLRLDYAWPTVTEMTVEGVGPDYLDMAVHPDSRYEIANEALYWVGEGWKFRDGPMQEYDALTDTTWRTGNLSASAVRVEERGAGKLRLFYSSSSMPTTSNGRVFQARDGIRDQVGALIVQSRKIAWSDVGVHFMHGLGLVCQFSEDISFERIELAPRPETGRTVAAFADCIHVSGCRGVVRVADSRFAGAHDDAINVHGTYMRVVGHPAADEVLLRFMHPQTYGFPAFFPGDRITFVRAGTLTGFAEAVVSEAKLLEPRVIWVKLDRDVPPDLRLGDVVENVTWTPEVEIVRNRLSRIPTRGVLVTTRRRALIEGNRFERIAMSAVLVAGDAGSWYESGCVHNLTIRGNSFFECGGAEHAVIAISPENAEPEFVHAGIMIEDNRFDMRAAPVLAARYAKELTFANNQISVHHGHAQQDREADAAIRLTGCDEVTLSGNRYFKSAAIRTP